MSRHDRSRTSMRDLIAEAERREIRGAEWMDRATLVRALEEGDADTAIGAIARARRFLGQVTGLDRVVRVVRGAIDPPRPQALSFAEVAPAAPAAPALPIAEPVIEAPIEVLPEPRIVIEPPTPPAASELLAGDPSFGGLRVVSREGHSWLVWRAPASRVAAIGRGSELTLRIVSIGCSIGEPDAEVIVHTNDERGLALEGVRPAPEASGRSCVAAIGLGSGEGFVAVAHARVA